MYVLVNGKLIEEKENIVSAGELGFNYGYGLFETIKFSGGKLFFFDEHIHRLQNSCKKLEIPADLDCAKLFCQITELIKSNGIIDGRIKIVCTKDKKVIISSGNNVYTSDRYKAGYKLCFAESLKNPHSKLTYLKSMNYLENLAEKYSAQKKGFDEALFLNIDGHLSEGSCTNIFFVKSGAVCTPDLPCGLLAGIIRHKVIDIVRSLDIKLVLGSFFKDDCLNAEEIFLTNSLMEIMPVCRLEQIEFDITSNLITKLISQEFKRLYH